MFCYSQVNKTLFRQNVFNQFLRYLHNDPLKVLYPLESRKLLKVQGKDAPVFLQGLITNDMHHFEEGAKSMYAMFLNNKGRVLYDTLIHKWEDSDSFIIECDKEVLSMLQRHLKLYKLKRIIQIEDINQQFRIWALRTANNTIVDTNISPKNSINIYKDPRLSDLGFRVLSVANMTGAQIAEKISNNIVVESDETGYSYFNEKELEMLKRYILALMENHHVSPEDIGVIAPYIRQVYKMKTWLMEHSCGKIEVGTVEAFQGKEKRVILVSTVRANCKLLDYDAKYGLGFLVDDKRFNVALTRAKAKIVIIGNPNCLTRDVKWRKYMELCEEYKCYFGKSTEQMERTTDLLTEVARTRFDRIRLTEELKNIKNKDKKEFKK